MYIPAVFPSMVLDLSELMEPNGRGWEAAKLDSAYVDKLLPGIVGFTIDTDQVDVQLRLSQQNNVDDRAKVTAALAAARFASGRWLRR